MSTKRETITLPEAIRRAEARVARHTLRTHPCDRAFDVRHLEWLRKELASQMPEEATHP